MGGRMAASIGHGTAGGTALEGAARARDGTAWDVCACACACGGWGVRGPGATPKSFRPQRPCRSENSCTSEAPLSATPKESCASIDAAADASALRCGNTVLHRQSESPPCETAQAQLGRMRYSASAACSVQHGTHRRATDATARLLSLSDGRSVPWRLARQQYSPVPPHPSIPSGRGLAPELRRGVARTSDETIETDGSVALQLMSILRTCQAAARRSLRPALCCRTLSAASQRVATLNHVALALPAAHTAVQCGHFEADRFDD